MNTFQSELVLVHACTRFVSIVLDAGDFHISECPEFSFKVSGRDGHALCLKSNTRTYHDVLFRDTVEISTVRVGRLEAALWHIPECTSVYNLRIALQNVYRSQFVT